MHNDLSFNDLDLGTAETKSKTILLVDDDPDLRSLTRTFLEHEGYAVVSCGDADRASHIFSNASPNAAPIDLLITDYYMPRRTGIDLAVELKQLDATLPVLLISGGVIGPESTQRLQEEGWSFLRKPFAVPDLLSAVHLILSE
jgi:two-component system chemotaxis response regulator CheY